jgi:hypothetical protein
MHLAHHPRLVIFAAALALATSPLLASSGAQAASAQSQPHFHFGLIGEWPMIVRSFNRAVAEAHGYKIITRDGIEMAVRANDPDAKPANTVTGNCGDSYVYAGGVLGTFEFYTGYKIRSDRPSGYEYEWFEDITGPPPYTNTLRQGPAVHVSYTWRYPSSGWHKIPVDDSGKYYIEVEKLSWVELTDGAICHSLGPKSSVTL